MCYNSNFGCITTTSVLGPAVEWPEHELLKISSFLRCLALRHPEMQTPKDHLWFRICSVLGKEGMYSPTGVQQGDVNPWPLWTAVYLKCVCKQKAIVSMLLSTASVCFLSRLTPTCSSCQQTVLCWFQWTAITKPIVPFLLLVGSQKKQMTKRNQVRRQLGSPSFWHEKTMGGGGVQVKKIF